MEEKKLATEIARLLSDSGFEFQRDPAIGGLTPDFVVRGPNNLKVILEAKNWDPRGGNTARAKEQVHLYLKATRLQNAFIVFPSLKRNYEDQGVVDLATLVPALNRLFSKTERRRQTRQPPIGGEVDQKIVFAAMPFKREYDDTFLVAMSYAAEKCDAVCRRVDYDDYAGDVVEHILDLISGSIAVFADLSESRPNVLFEAGFARALGKPVIQICSTPLGDLPFDIRNWNTIPYSMGGTTALKTKLARTLAEVLSE